MLETYMSFACFIGLFCGGHHIIWVHNFTVFLSDSWPHCCNVTHITWCSSWHFWSPELQFWYIEFLKWVLCMSRILSMVHKSLTLDDDIYGSIIRFRLQILGPPQLHNTWILSCINHCKEKQFRQLLLLHMCPAGFHMWATTTGCRLLEWDLIFRISSNHGQQGLPINEQQLL